ncbi:hypothetical protein ebA5219 [Aromatoleum aromaticum EbN1]|uniref:Uncharacterized protein n=1 Tax=Aromatoleum aromaticum (strain DSM 19018 / LMG 30748 / EbN1) TaxID=76114 RepID=Q5P0T0_AROAE|nr:hypothetical protein ebA5219 [Aromatoleum aromaticum EbN1]
MQVAGGFEIARFGQHAQHDLQKLGLRAGRPRPHYGVALCAISQKGVPVGGRQGVLQSAQVLGHHIAHEIPEQPAVLDCRSEQDLQRDFLFPIGHHLPAQFIQRFQPIADESRLATGGGRRLFLQDVVVLEGVNPGNAIRMSEQQAGNAATFDQHQRASRDFGVIERRRFCHRPAPPSPAPP